MRLLLACLLSLAVSAAEGLRWRPAEDLVDAQIEGWPLTRLLEKIAAKTRWEIYLEPETRYTVSARFQGLSGAEALRRLLGNLSFLLVPAKDRPPTLYIFRTSMQAATDLIAAPKEKEAAASETAAIPDELVVRLKPGSKESIDELAKRLGAKVVGRIEDLHAYRLKFDDADAAQAARGLLADDPNVDALEANYTVARPDRPEALAMGPLPPLNLRPKAVTDNSRVVIGLIDTGVQTEGTVLKDFLLPGLEVAGKADLPPDQPTHGTSMAETMLYALSQAPDAAKGTPVRILPVDVYGNAENSTTFDIARGISQAISGGAQIINLSLGGDSNSRLVQEVIKAGHEQGIVFLAAAGNEPTTAPTYPAAYPEVLAVTATTRGGQLASYANRGDFVDVAAPGTSLVPFQSRPYLVVGTSAATANASAVAATFMAASQKRGAELEAQVRQSLAVQAKPPGP